MFAVCVFRDDSFTTGTSCAVYALSTPINALSIIVTNNTAENYYRIWRWRVSRHFSVSGHMFYYVLDLFLTSNTLWRACSRISRVLCPTRERREVYCTLRVHSLLFPQHGESLLPCPHLLSHKKFCSLRQMLKKFDIRSWWNKDRIWIWNKKIIGSLISFIDLIRSLFSSRGSPALPSDSCWFYAWLILRPWDNMVLRNVGVVLLGYTA